MSRLNFEVDLGIELVSADFLSIYQLSQKSTKQGKLGKKVFNRVVEP